MENSTLSFALTGVVPAVCDAEAGERRRSNLTVFQARASKWPPGSSRNNRERRPRCIATGLGESPWCTWNGKAGEMVWTPPTSRRVVR
jgi:hypothetical protein